MADLGAFAATLAVATFIGVYWWIHVPTSNAVARQEFFVLRRELFMLMAEGKIDRVDPAFKLTYSFLNHTIRNVEKITLTRLLWSRAKGTSPPSAWRRAEASWRKLESDEARAFFETLFERIGMVLMSKWVLNSPVFWMAIVYVLPGVIFRTLRKSTGNMAADVIRSSPVETWGSPTDVWDSFDGGTPSVG